MIEEEKLLRNLKLLRYVQEAAGVEIILAFKGFASWHAFPMIKKYLAGATASSLNEARLCKQELDVKAHTYAVAYKKSEFSEYQELSSHITFNSLSQLDLLRPYFKVGEVSYGLRINPGFSTVKTELYNPASTTSRLGVDKTSLENGLPDGVEGIHFHVLCESDSHSLERVLSIVEKDFPKALSQARWLNMGGGHLLTGDEYDIDHLVELLKRFRLKHNLDVILEPGSAVVWQTGFLMSEVVDIVERGGVQTAILDISITCHMPDCLEMPYKPRVDGAYHQPVEGLPTYRIGGVSCLAGDFIGDYSFDQPLEIGQKLFFEDMIHYTMVKTTMFNGIHHPSIGMLKKDGDFELWREFGFEDFKMRLG